MAASLRMLSAALNYAAIGWYVFPLSETGDIKAPNPILGKKEGHRKATIDEKQIRAWWTKKPNAGIGVWLEKSGLIAIDIDPRDHGDTALAELERIYGKAESAVVATTGGGGEHRIFLAPAGLKSPPGRVGNRKGVDLKFNGYIVVAPSPHPSGKRYAWQADSSPFAAGWLMGECPAWILRRDGPRAVTPYVNGATVDVFAEDTAKVGYTLEQISEALDAIPNAGDEEQPYEDWLNVLAGIYHETDGGEDGRVMAEAWSERSMKHESEKFAKSWNSLAIEGKGRAPVTFRFALKLARAAMRLAEVEAVKEFRAQLALVSNLIAFRDLCETIAAADIDSFARSDLVAELQKAFLRLTTNRLTIGEARAAIRRQIHNFDVPAWLEGWVHCAYDDRFFQDGSDEGLSPGGFNSRFNINMLTRTDRLQGKGVPDLRATDAALNLYDIPKVHGRMYLPNAGKFFTIGKIEYLNTYSNEGQPDVPEVTSPLDRRNVALVEAHFVHLVANPRERELLISWLAYIVQTQERVNWFPVLQGPQKDGKTFIVELMGIVLGGSGKNVKLVDPDTLHHTFTDWAEGSLLTVFEEIKLHGAKRFDVIDKLKPFISNRNVSIHPKGFKVRTVINTTSYLAFTNYRDALPLDKNDTRYFLLASPRQTPEDVQDFHDANPSYFAELFATLSESPGALRKWLLNYPLHPEFNAKARAPASREKAYLIGATKSELQDAVESAVDEYTSPVISAELIETGALLDYLAAADFDIPMSNTLRHLLLNQLGYTFIGRFRIAGKDRRYWSRTPDKFAAPNTAGTAKAIRFYLGAADL